MDKYNFFTITNTEELNKIFEQANDKLVVIMFFTKTPECRMARRFFEKTAMNHTISIFGVIDVDKFQGNSRILNSANNMPKFECYYMGNVIGSVSTSNDKEIENIVRSGEQYVMTQNNMKNMESTMPSGQIGMMQPMQINPLQIRQNILNQAQMQNPMQYQYLMQNPMILQQLVQNQMQMMQQQQMIQPQMMQQQQMMQPQMMQPQMIQPQMIQSQIPNMNTSTTPQLNTPVIMPQMSAPNSTIPTFQQMQQMFQIFQMMQQMGILNVPDSNTSVNNNTDTNITNNNKTTIDSDNDNSYLLPNGDRIIPLPNGKFGLIKKTNQ